MKVTLTFFAATLLSCFTFAQNCTSDYYQYLEVNQVKAIYYNGGDMFWDLSSSPVYQVPKVSNPASARHSMFASAVWMGGIDNSGALHQAAQTYRQSGNDYFPGPIRTKGGYGCTKLIDLYQAPYFNSILQHSKGKMLHFYNTGFSITDPATMATTNKILPINMENYEAVELQDGRVLLFGDAKYMTPQNWIILDSNFTPAVGSTLIFNHLQAEGILLNNGKVLIAGRFGSEIFDPANGTSVPADSMITHAQARTGIRLADGKVFMTGGSSMAIGSYFPTHDETEIYDPATDTWTAGPSMTFARARHSLTLLASGKVLILGGSAITKNIELFDPATNTISVVGSTNELAEEATATIMPTGDILVGLRDKGLFRCEILDTTTFVSKTITLNGIGSHVTTLSDGKVLVQKSSQYFTQYDPIKDEFVDFPWQKIWNVTSAQISQFLQDKQNGSVLWSKYPDIKSWPAHGDSTFGEDAQIAPFKDNGNGIYRPLFDVDVPCILGDQALYWVFNDEAEAHTETGGDALGVQVEAMAYAFDCNQTNCPDTSLDYTTFYHYELVNKSGNDYHDFYFSFWSDYDLGNFSDDYIGCDTNLGMGFCFNGDANDETASGYGLNPPAIGNLVLSAPYGKSMTNFMYYENDFSPSGNPEMATHYYGYMKSYFKDGSHLVDNGSNGFPGTAPGPQTNFIYPGKVCPTPSGWSEPSAGNQPFDRRALQSIGPYDFNSGDTLSFDFAIIWARKFANDNLGSVCELKKNAATIKSWWSGLQKDCFNVQVSKTKKVEELLFGFYPNPAQSSVRLQLEKPANTDFDVIVSDLTGRVISSGKLPIGSFQMDIDLSTFSNGVYVIMLTGANAKANKKLIVSR